MGKSNVVEFERSIAGSYCIVQDAVNGPVYSDGQEDNDA